MQSDLLLLKRFKAKLKVRMHDEAYRTKFK